MAQYKVPQDVEADDKLLGPFNFRQFVYLLIAGGLIAIAVFLFKIFPLLALIPLPPVLLLLALALPLKKDQPMETYLAAIVSFYLKPHTRLWWPGQRESTITITAPKIVEPSRTRSITGEEATHRLSFLADIVDTGGYAIKGASNNSMREDILAEAEATTDMFEGRKFDNLSGTIRRDETARHDEVIQEMRNAIVKAETITTPSTTPIISRHADPATFSVPKPTIRSQSQQPAYNSSVVVSPDLPIRQPAPAPAPAQTNPTPSPKPRMVELSNNQDFSVATIAKEANRINGKDNGEVFISLH